MCGCGCAYKWHMCATQSLYPESIYGIRPFDIFWIFLDQASSAMKLWVILMAAGGYIIILENTFLTS